MTGLRYVGMGLVLVVVDVALAGYDAVPDVLGWALIGLGLHGLRGRLLLSALLPLALLAGVVSLGTLRPELVADLPESTGWLLSLPQTVFCLVLCAALAPLVARPIEGRWRFLCGVFGVLAGAPVLVYGGGLDVLVVPLSLVAVAANVYLIYLLFRSAGELHATPADAPRA